MDVDLAAGHGGKSGRFDNLKDIARLWAFALMIHDPSRQRSATGRASSLREPRTQ